MTEVEIVHSTTDLLAGVEIIDEDSYEMGRDYSFDGNFHGKGRYNSYNDNFYGRKRDYTIDTSSLDKKEKKELLYMTPIQKAKNRKKKNRK